MGDVGRPSGQPALALRAEPASGLDAARFDQAQVRVPPAIQRIFDDLANGRTESQK